MHGGLPALHAQITQAEKVSQWIVDLNRYKTKISSSRAGYGSGFFMPWPTAPGLFIYTE
jgi:hypothetical protein